MTQHRHQYQHRPGPDTDQWSAGFWDEHYSAHDQVWSGRANRWLVTDAADLPPGRALDAGCGEGADAVWLAQRSWQVSAIDVSTVALDRARVAAAAAGVTDRVEFSAGDLRTFSPPARSFDLVNAQYLHLPSALRHTAYTRLAEAVAPGGTLLIVAHHPRDLDGPMPRPSDPDLFPTEQDLAAGLDPGTWEILACDARPHPATHPDGHQVTVYDAVLRARRC